MRAIEQSPDDNSPAVIYATVATVSGSALLFELFQTRILSFIFWNHIVYLAISIALLGFGVSGTVVSWITRKPILNLAGMITRLSVGLSLSFILARFAIAIVLPLYFGASSPQAKLTFCYAVSIPPFIFAGSILALLFSHARQSMGRLYAVDLGAASIGCILFFFLLPLLGGAPAVTFLALLAAGIALYWGWHGLPKARIYLVVLAVTAAELTIIGLLRPHSLDFHPEGYKDLALILSQHGTIERTKWTPINRIDLLDSQTGVNLPGYRVDPPYSDKIITQDGSANTALLSSEVVHDINKNVREGKPTYPAPIPYAILDHPDVAIIGTGGGIEVAYALAHDAHSVFAIELNPFTYQLTKNIYSGWNGGLLHDPRVTAINDEGRSAIRRSKKQFDLIEVIAIDTFAALNSGAYVLSENYLYTVDAFSDYFTHLKPGGMLTLFRWNNFPPREPLRLVALAAQAWRERGVTAIDNRVMVLGDLGDMGWALTIFKDTPFTKAEVQQLFQETQKNRRFVIFWPKVYPPAQQAAMEKSYYDSVSEPTVVTSAHYFNTLVSAYQSGTEGQFFQNYPFKVTPVTDDSPFFFESSSLFKLSSWIGGINVARGIGAQTTLIDISVLSTLVMLGAIIFPLRILHAQGLQVSNAGSYMVYFASLGFGFMILEISLMQKSVLVLGSPMYAIPIVLAGILVSAGIGSAISARWEASFKNKIAASGLLLVVATAVASMCLSYGANFILPMGFIFRAILSVAFVIPVGILLGIFFPTGLQLLRDQAPEFVPWAWGINGCASVYGSVLAILIAMWHGFNFAIAFGVLLYAVAVISSRFITESTVTTDEARVASAEAARIRTSAARA